MTSVSIAKRLLKSTGSQVLLAGLAALVIRLVQASTRWQEERPPEAGELLRQSAPFIGCFWHGRMLLMGHARPRRQAFHLLISGHRDGQFISRAVAHLGVATVAGSSRRGGAEALRGIHKLLQRGDAVGITPDGPRGPRMRAKPGAIKAAQLAGVPILPVSAAISHCRILKTWDGFCIPWPFARGVILWGAPITVPASADAETLEAARQRLESELNRLTAEAESRCGQIRVEPAAESWDGNKQPNKHEARGARA